MDSYYWSNEQTTSDGVKHVALFEPGITGPWVIYSIYPNCEVVWYFGKPEQEDRE